MLLAQNDLGWMEWEREEEVRLAFDRGVLVESGEERSELVGAAVVVVEQRQWEEEGEAGRLEVELGLGVEREGSERLLLLLLGDGLEVEELLEREEEVELPVERVVWVEAGSLTLKDPREVDPEGTMKTRCSKRRQEEVLLLLRVRVDLSGIG